MYQNYSDSYGTSSSNAFGTHNSYTPYPSQVNASASSIMSRMNETSALELLQHLDKGDLQHLLDDDSKLRDLIEDLPQVKSLQSEHDDLVATNKSLAEYNLSQQPKLESLKHDVARKYEAVNSLKTDLAESKAKLDGYVGQQSLETMLALLQTETAKSEEESEQLADSFCGGQMSIEEFLCEYIPKRTKTHLRRIKSERFAELIRDSQNTSSQVTWTLTSQPSHQHTHSVPYPSTGTFGMPQPSLYPR